MLFNIKNRGFRNTKSCGVFIKFLSLFRTKCVSFCNAFGSLILQRNVRNVKKRFIPAQTEEPCTVNAVNVLNVVNVDQVNWKYCWYGYYQYAQPPIV